ncbi:hypothetical protein SO802_029681 [Lithocarpus litseifolius]|uniref:Gnk2-homologous domain-containing protein n=1 Tax=Lithocarpus litseifolius TaxID=425828 RepID=A0AAW2BUC0_9ROSI
MGFLLICRDDVSARDCQTCVNEASSEIPHLCRYNKAAIICNTTTFTNQTRELLSLLAVEATLTPELYAVGELDVAVGGSNKLYGLVQCTRDLSSSDCFKCLDGLPLQLQNTNPLTFTSIVARIAPNQAKVLSPKLQLYLAFVASVEISPERRKGAVGCENRGGMKHCEGTDFSSLPITSQMIKRAALYYNSHSGASISIRHMHWESGEKRPELEMRESVQVALRPKVSWVGSGVAGVVQVERVKSASTSLRRALLSPSFSEFFSDNGPVDIMDEDAISNLSIRVKLHLTVWDFILPVTLSLPAVFGISDTVNEDRFGVEHGTQEWYEALDQHFKWLLQFRISPYFCKWGDSIRVLTYTSPYPADHPKSDEYFSDPRLAAYAVPYSKAVFGSDAAKDYLLKEIGILRTKNHWKKAYFYLWDEPLNLEQNDSIRKMASEIHAYAPDARVLTTYYCGPSDAPLAPTAFEAFVEVPNFLRPHTQIYCTSEWVLGNREDLVKGIIGELQPESGESVQAWMCLLIVCTRGMSRLLEMPTAQLVKAM